MPVRIRQHAQAPRPRALLTTPPCEGPLESLDIVVCPGDCVRAAFHELDHPSSDVQACVSHLTKPCFT